MNVVIQCAAQKDPNAGHWSAKGGKIVSFVANPDLTDHPNKMIYARPDDMSPEGLTWRSLVWNYNKSPGRNPLNLYPAYRLYRNEAYRALVRKFGVQKTFILSAGWGLIRADLLTPQYNITFSSSAGKEYRRSKQDRYKDFCMLPNDGGSVVFFGGKDYLPLFASLTNGFKGKRTVYYNSSTPPDLPRCTFRRYETATRTNWHYECVKAFIVGDLE